VAAGGGALPAHARTRGNERLAIDWTGLASATSPSDFGDPVGGDAVQLVCVYDASDALALALRVDRAGDSCGAKPCWKALGTKGFAYKDPLAATDGVTRTTWRSGPAGRGAISLRAANSSAAGEASLPTGVAARLSGQPSATVQARAIGGTCFTLALDTVAQSGPIWFKAKP
jgi:hypothetical protein